MWLAQCTEMCTETTYICTLQHNVRKLLQLQSLLIRWWPKRTSRTHINLCTQVPFTCMQVPHTTQHLLYRADVYMYGLRSMENSRLADACCLESSSKPLQPNCSGTQEEQTIRSNEIIPHLVVDTMFAVFH